MNRFFIFIGLFVCFFVSISLHAAPKPVIVIEENRLPSIYVENISGSDRARLTDVLKRDLSASGSFRMMDAAKDAEYRVEASFQKNRLDGSLLKGSEAIFSEVIDSNDMSSSQAAVHQFADHIIEKITGRPGISSSEITFISSGSGSKEVYIADIDGANARQLSSDKVISLGPKFSSDGKKIAYTSYKSNFPDVWVMDLTNKKRKRVAFYPGINCQPAFSPDGEKIALTLSKDGNTELYTIDANGGNPQRLTRTRGTEASPCWSPDGTEIAYVSDERGSPQIYTISSKGGEPTRIKTASPYATDPSWSPDGKRVAYSARVAGRFQIGVTDLATGEATLLTNQGDSETPSWTRNSRHLVYARNGDLYLLDSFTQKSLKIPLNLTSCSEPHIHPY